MKEPFAITARTMAHMQEKYPDARVYFVAGADKLDLLEEFQRKWGFLDRYNAVVFAREDSHLMEQIAEHELLSTHRSSIVPVASPEGIDGVSSTKVRKQLFDIDQVANMLYPDVAAMLRELKKDDFPEEILEFKGEYDFLSNDYPSEVLWEGIRFPCATSAFLASRFNDLDVKKAISGMGLLRAKQRYNISGSEAWQGRQVSTMEQIVRSKFRQNNELKDRLLSTCNRRLVNGQKKDRFWGIDLITWEGENHLGMILMRIRNEFLKGVTK